MQTLVVVLLVIVVVVEIDIMLVLRNVHHQRADAISQLAFTADEIRQITARAIKANYRLQIAAIDFDDRFDVDRKLTEEESEEFTRLNADYRYVEEQAANEWFHRDLMVQANGRVCSGIELISDARSRVSQALHDRRIAKVIEKT